MTQIRIRPATPADADAVAAMCVKLTEHESEQVCRFSPQHFIADGFGPGRAFDCLLAERGGAPIGYALYHPEYNTDLMQRSTYLVDLYVEPEARRSGVGRQLMAATAKAGAAAGATMLSWTVERWNDDARILYRKVGREQPELFYGVAAHDRLEALAALPERGDIRIRPATADDVPTLARFVTELLRATAGEPPAAIEGPLARDGFGPDPAFEAILAEDRSGPLGHALFWPCYDTEHAVRGGFLSDLYVAPRGRRRGAGRGLLGAVARRSRAARGDYLYWQILASNAPAIAFYAAIAEQDRAAMPCLAAGEDFRSLVALAAAFDPDDGR